MENFIFYYTLFRDYNFSLASIKADNNFAKNFIAISKKICELEAQTFLTDESKNEIKKYYQELEEQIHKFELVKYSKKQWRLFIGLMCTLEEWCRETNFFNLSIEEQKFIFPENPVEGYYKNIKNSTEFKL